MINYFYSRSQFYRKSAINFFAVILPVILLSTGFFFGNPSLGHSQTATSKGSLDLNELGVQAMKKNNYQRAEELFTEALDHDPHNLTAAFNLAGAYLNNKKIEKAVTLLETYTSQYQEDVGLWARLGDTYFSQKKLPQAQKAYETAVKLNPAYPNTLTKLATVQGLQGQMEKAEATLRQAVKVQPTDASAHASLASILLNKGNSDEAVSFAKKSLQIKPTPQVYVTLGSAYEQKKDPKSALIAFQRAQDLGDKGGELASRIEKLKKGHS